MILMSLQEIPLKRVQIKIDSPNFIGCLKSAAKLSIILCPMNVLLHYLFILLLTLSFVNIMYL